MKIAVKTLKPRNPYATAARSRNAGVHRGGDRRQQAERALRRDIDRDRPSP